MPTPMPSLADDPRIRAVLPDLPDDLWWWVVRTDEVIITISLNATEASGPTYGTAIVALLDEGPIDPRSLQRIRAEAEFLLDEHHRAELWLRRPHAAVHDLGPASDPAIRAALPPAPFGHEWFLREGTESLHLAVGYTAGWPKMCNTVEIPLSGNHHADLRAIVASAEILTFQEGLVLDESGDSAEHSPWMRARAQRRASRPPLTAA